MHGTGNADLMIRAIASWTIGEHFKEVLGQPRVCAYRKEENQARDNRKGGGKGKLKEIKRLRLLVPWFLWLYITWALDPYSRWGEHHMSPWVMVRLATSVEPLNFVFCLSTRPNRRIGSLLPSVDRERGGRKEIVVANCQNLPLRLANARVPSAVSECYLITNRGEFF